MDTSRIKGLIFDMDNTILKSHIDFPAMKAEVYHYLRQSDLIPEMAYESMTTSTLLAAAKKSPMTEVQWQSIWSITERHEIKGMLGAPLEPFAKEVLSELADHYYCTILTNNAYEAALYALKDNSIHTMFHMIYGREQAGHLKPSDEGVRRLIANFPHTGSENWLFIGDSWIDGKAAHDAGMPFIAYKADLERMAQNGVTPDYSISCLTELLTLLI